LRRVGASEGHSYGVSMRDGRCQYSVECLDQIACTGVYYESAFGGEDRHCDSDMDMESDRMYTNTLSLSLSFSWSPSFKFFLTHSLSLVLSDFNSVSFSVFLFHTHTHADLCNPFLNFGMGIERYVTDCGI